MRPLNHHRLGVIHLRLQICDGLLRSITALSFTSDLVAQSVRAHAWHQLWTLIDAMRDTLFRHGRLVHDLDRARGRRGSVILVATNFAAPTVETRGAAADALVHIRALIAPDLRNPPRQPAAVVIKPAYRIPAFIFLVIGAQALVHILLLATR